MQQRNFPIPPVTFPGPTSSSPPNQNPTYPPGASPPLQNRRVPTPSFQPPSQSTSSLPFMSFDVSSHSTSYPPSLAPQTHSSSSSTLFLDEPSLLEELEINPTLIWQKTKSLLNPLNPSPTLHTSSPDLSGPFLYYITLSLFQLLAGKVQFGIILGWIAISSIFLYAILNFLAGRNGSLDLYRAVSVVGYCLMPIVFFSAVSLFLPPFTGGSGSGSVIGFVIAGVFVTWATRVCSRLLAEDSLGGGAVEYRGLIAYPCFLIYTLFSMLVMF